MAGALTNRGVKNILDASFRGTAIPTNFYIVLVTGASTPTVDTNTLSELTEIAAGNGYTSGGFQLTPGATDFDTLTEDDATDKAYIQIKDVSWTASGGAVPASGNPARWAVLTDDNSTLGSREIWGYFDLGADKTLADTEVLTLADCQMNLSTV